MFGIWDEFEVGAVLVLLYFLSGCSEENCETHTGLGMRSDALAFSVTLQMIINAHA